jgi:hypothetical protein
MRARAPGAGPSTCAYKLAPARPTRAARRLVKQWLASGRGARALRHCRRLSMPDSTRRLRSDALVSLALPAASQLHECIRPHPRLAAAARDGRQARSAGARADAGENVAGARYRSGRARPARPAARCTPGRRSIARGHGSWSWSWVIWRTHSHSGRPLDGDRRFLGLHPRVSQCACTLSFLGRDVGLRSLRRYNAAFELLRARPITRRLPKLFAVGFRLGEGSAAEFRPVWAPCIKLRSPPH